MAWASQRRTPCLSSHGSLLGRSGPAMSRGDEPTPRGHSLPSAACTVAWPGSSGGRERRGRLPTAPSRRPGTQGPGLSGERKAAVTMTTRTRKH